MSEDRNPGVRYHVAMPALDIENLQALLIYLRQTRRITADEEPRFRILTGGVSNRTVIVDGVEGESWVIKQALAKLRVAADWYSDPLRIHREAMGLRELSKLAPAGSTVDFVFEDHEHHLFAMTAVPEPHVNFKTLLLQGKVRLAQIEEFARLLGTIHARAAEQASELAPLFNDRSFFESLRLEPYYQYVGQQVPSAAAFLNELVESCRQRRFTLVHGDFSPKNILIHQERLIMLDHEVIHWGDPAFDLGFALTHLLGKAHHLTSRRHQFAEAAAHFWRIYCSTIGSPPWSTDLERHAVRHTLGCLLARVAGRSPLEYLNANERDRQREVVTNLMTQPPMTMNVLIDRFVTLITESR